MENYKKNKKIGRGSFGVVSRAINKKTGEVVAIKKLMTKYDSWDECMELREVKALMKMNNHRHIVNVKEIFKQGDFLYMVFEYMECNLSQLIEQQNEPFSETKIREMCFQLFQGLAHMHGNGYVHRDLKPANLLVNKDIIKIGDLGTARKMDGSSLYTNYVTTRWYRAPEALLGSRLYDHKVDMWAMGAIMAELFTLKPLFPGNSEAGMLYTICSVLGTPTKSTWCEGHTLATIMNYRFPEFQGMQFSEILPSASPDLVNLISGLISWNPFKRPKAMEALQHPFFNCCYHVSRPLHYEPANLNFSLIFRPSVSNLSLQHELLKKARNLGTGSCPSPDPSPSPSVCENWDDSLCINVLFEECPATRTGSQQK
ncbi:Kinase superfamily protein isoform 4 [Artemisia annua]|uniref:Kinase superfamily protein isoform 4 n=1 Tax=Artemisia annua TaxID=35608 RepID=A0A2U1KYF4_ARTAN|nr:Kinase superfamily protein isoform 4 [Artemisia annua]